MTGESAQTTLYALALEGDTSCLPLPVDSSRALTKANPSNHSHSQSPFKTTEFNMSEFQIKPAQRQSIKPLIGLYAESGNGKTYSALLLARGMAGPSGKIVMGDTESGRGSLYTDVLPGSYETFQFDSPFSPARYIKAIEAIEQSGAAVGILDSGSHEWEGMGGVLDMAAENESSSGRAGLHNWKKPKMEHALFVQKLLRCSVPLIICLRAKYKTRQTKDNGKTVIVKDDKTTPIQADDFIFEMTAHAEILPDHSIILTKWSHPSLKQCFPEKGPIEIKHGEMIAKWCGAAVASKPANQPEGIADARQLVKALWEVLKPVRGESKTWDTAESFLRVNGLLQEGQHVRDLSAGELIAVTDAVTKLV